MKAAIVDDEKSALEKLCKHLAVYGEKHGIEIETCEFSDVFLLLINYKPEYDVIFMDINLLGLNGMDGAKKLREQDPEVPIVFVTSLVRYATEGYSVNAFDYIVKPYSYEAVEMTVDALLKRVKNKEIVVSNLGGYTRIPVSSIQYVEINKHRVLYHTDFGVVDVWGSMAKAENELKDAGFAKCGASWLVNLHQVKAVEGNWVTVGDIKIRVSRAKKKEFLLKLHEIVAR